ncbi:hypothetical protein PUG46_06830 [Erwiniaceae bacterium L1_55_4]|nr:hypothetical protein [Erwiniaceae bacterium L1_55_4]
MEGSKVQYFGEIYNKIVSEFPDKPWVTHISHLVEKKGDTIDVLGDKSIAYGLSLFDSEQYDKADVYLKNIVSDSLFYCANFLEVLRTTEGSVNKTKLRKKFSAAFLRSDSMRAIQFEIFSLIFLSKANNKVECKDNSFTNDTYDYLVTDEFNVKTQVECKSFSYDRGLYITASQANKIQSYLMARLQPVRDILITESLGMLCSISINIKDKIGNDNASLEAISNEIISSLIDDKKKINKGYELDIQIFNNVDDISEEFCYEKLNSKSNKIELASFTDFPNENNSRIHLKITSELTLGYLDKFEGTCKEAVKRQLKKDKPASLFIHYTNGEVLLHSINQASFLKRINKLFEREHLTSIVFAANIHVDEQDEYPYFSTNPIFLIAKNKNAKFKNSTKFLDGLHNKREIHLG